MRKNPLVFVSYARPDIEPVRQIVEELHALGVKTWTDFGNLSPGENWTIKILEAIREAEAVLVFISPESVRSKSVTRGIRLAKIVIPVLLRSVAASEFPPELAELHSLDISRYSPATASKQVAAEIMRILSQPSAVPPPAMLADRKSEELAAAFATQARDQAERPKRKDQKSPDSIFIVHGHDEEFLRDVETFLIELGIKPIIMKDVGGASASLIQKFFEVGGKADFAIILLSGDDLGASRRQYEVTDVGNHALKYRARQNVTLELGFFYGSLGWENVFVLEKEPSKPYPDFERPSDLNGVLWDRFDITGRWRKELRRRLSQRGFMLDAISTQAAVTT